jgi:hypothetical protein
VTVQAIWSAGDNTIAKAAPSGRIVASSPGSTSIVANYDGTTAKASLVVTGTSDAVPPDYGYITGFFPLVACQAFCSTSSIGTDRCRR